MCARLHGASVRRGLPEGAVSIDPFTRKSIIDQEKCIKCGRCVDVCAYKAINHQKRPCAAACGMDAIHSDQNGRADIDYDKCVSCGQCLVNCPFGAIADKSQIFQMIRAIQAGERVYAAVAPAFVGQFGPKVTPGKLRAAMKQLASPTSSRSRSAPTCVRRRRRRLRQGGPLKSCRSWRRPAVRLGL